MKGCRSIRRLILCESDERLGVEQAFALEEHLARCGACRRFRDVELEIRQALALCAEPSLPAATLEQALASVQAELARPARPPAALRARRSLQAAGVVLLVGAGLLGLWRAGGGRSTLPPATHEPALSTGPATEETARAALPPAPDLPPEASAGTPRTPDELRQHLRAELVAAFAGWRADQDPAACVALFAERTARLSASWQLERFVEELVLDPDVELACAAARVLGARGDRLSAPALRAALARAEVAPSAVAALAALGAGGLAGLEQALSVEALEPLALPALAEVGGADAALVLERALADQRVGPARDARRVQALASLGAPAVASLLRLAERDRERRGLFLGALERMSATADALVPLLSGGHVSSELNYEAALRLPSPGALAWLRERCLERGERDAALSALARWEGVEPLELALELSASGRLSAERVEALVTALLASDPRRARALASELVATRSSMAGELLELLLGCGVAHSGAACATLTEAELPEDQRLLAALAAGELGEPADLGLLAQAFQRSDPRERRLRAALLLSIHRLGGEEGLALALASEARDEAWTRLLQALDEAAARGAAVSIHRVARALDGVAPRPRDPWRST